MLPRVITIEATTRTTGSSGVPLRRSSGASQAYAQLASALERTLIAENELHLKRPGAWLTRQLSDCGWIDAVYHGLGTERKVNRGRCSGRRLIAMSKYAFSEGGSRWPSRHILNQLNLCTAFFVERRTHIQQPISSISFRTPWETGTSSPGSESHVTLMPTRCSTMPSRTWMT